MSEKLKAPKLRFPGFTDAWEQRELGEVSKITMGQSPNGNTYSETPSEYILIQGNADLKDGWAVPRVWTTQMTKRADAGDLIMSVRAPAGAMGKTAYDAVIGRGVAAIKGNEFIYQTLIKMDSNGYWKKLAAGSTFESLNSNSITQAKILIPSNDEQNKIGDFFSKIDNIITLQQRKLETFKKLKKGFLQKMFPKNGESVPEIRFPGFTAAWEQRKFGDTLETVTDYVAAGSFADLANNVEYKDSPNYAQLVRTMDLKNGFTSSQEVYVDKKAFDYLYRVNMDKECIILPNIGNCGEVYYIKPENLPYEHNVLGPNAIFVRSDTNANDFLSFLFQSKDFQTKLKLIVSPNGQTKFNKTELKGIDLILPSNKEEQKKIGQYFSNLDNLITLQQRKLESLKKIKQGLLQQMFI